MFKVCYFRKNPIFFSNYFYINKIILIKGNNGKKKEIIQRLKQISTSF